MRGLLGERASTRKGENLLAMPRESARRCQARSLVIVVRRKREKAGFCLFCCWFALLETSAKQTSETSFISRDRSRGLHFKLSRR
jgi:hypothetical protein